MWSFMESTKPGVFAQGNAEGLERVKKGNGKYAFLMESTTIEYVIERECDTTQIGGLLDSKGYGIALPPGMYVHSSNTVVCVRESTKPILCSKQSKGPRLKSWMKTLKYFTKNILTL